jgi:hypothetical protein
MPLYCSSGVTWCILYIAYFMVCYAPFVKVLENISTCYQFLPITVLKHPLLIKGEDHHLSVKIWTILYPRVKIWLVVIGRVLQVQLLVKFVLYNKGPTKLNKVYYDTKQIT